MANLAVNIAGVTLKNPVITASGCCGFGREFLDFYPLSALGGISLKGTTLNPREGNPPHRIAEAPAGMLNSVGLQNPGVKVLLEKDLPWLKEQNTVLIANLAGSSPEEYRAVTEAVEGSDIDMIELNISCPNVKAGGIGFGTDCGLAAGVIREVRAATTKPLIVKLTPNVTDITAIAKVAEAEGADAVSLINTITAMRIDINTRRPILHNNTGGLSGPAVFPVAVRMVWQAANAVKIPVIGLGGISTWQDGIEMMMAGARAIQVGAALFTNPMAPVEIVEGMNAWLDKQGIKDINEIVGTVKPW
ncbi:MAG: dihydroorotate dehydrogenase [Oscillospiraceae bacterium]|nr:dihydroorotate dehydrogenase [Oscillospiraceae bacterium]